MTLWNPHQDVWAESRHLIALLEENRDFLPFAEEALTRHHSLHCELEATATASEQAVAHWRAMLARRWESEVAARRLFKQVYRQLLAHFGSEQANELRLLNARDTMDVSPNDLLRDLRQLHACLLMLRASLPFADTRLTEIDIQDSQLEIAIRDAEQAEEQRRRAALNFRLVQEAFYRARSETQRRLDGSLNSQPMLIQFQRLRPS